MYQNKNIGTAQAATVPAVPGCVPVVLGYVPAYVRDVQNVWPQKNFTLDWDLLYEKGKSTFKRTMRIENRKEPCRSEAIRHKIVNIFIVL